MNNGEVTGYLQLFFTSDLLISLQFLRRAAHVPALRVSARPDLLQQGAASSTSALELLGVPWALTHQAQVPKQRHWKEKLTCLCTMLKNETN